MGKRGARMGAAVVVAGLIGGGIWGGLALAGPSHPTPAVDTPVVAGNSVATTAPPPSTTTTAPTTTTTTTTTQPQPAIGAPAGCRYTNTCAPGSGTTSP